MLNLGDTDSDLEILEDPHFSILSDHTHYELSQNHVRASKQRSVRSQETQWLSNKRNVREIIDLEADESQSEEEMEIMIDDEDTGQINARNVVVSYESYLRQVEGIETT